MVENCYENRRIEWIDMARGILFIFVIICHSRLASPELKWFYEPVFLTGFFFLSGYLFKSRPMKLSIKHLANALFIPFILYSLIFGVIGIIHTKSIYGGLLALADNCYGGDMVWFIPSLILVELIYVVVDSLHAKYADYAIITFSIIFVFISTEMRLSRGFWCWETALFAVGFFALGNLFKGRLLSLKASTILFFVYIVVGQWAGSAGLLSGIDMHLNHYEHPLVFSIFAILGCVSCISLISHFPSFRYVSMFGRYTLFMFPFHGFVLRAVLKIGFPYHNWLVSGGG